MTSDFQTFDSLVGRPVACFSGIANAGAFERTIRSLGADLRSSLRFPDHHRYDRGDLQRIADRALQAGAELLLTTEKDAVKLTSLGLKSKVEGPRSRIEIEHRDPDPRTFDLQTCPAGPRPSTFRPSTLGFDWPIPVAALRVEIEFLDDGSTVLENHLQSALAQVRGLKV